MNSEEKRRELFEAWYFETYQKPVGVEDSPTSLQLRRGNAGDYAEYPAMRNKWVGFNAALDAMVINLPLPVTRAYHEYDLGYNEALDHCESAIESTGLGLKVLP